MSVIKSQCAFFLSVQAFFPNIALNLIRSRYLDRVTFFCKDKFFILFIVILDKKLIEKCYIKWTYPGFPTNYSTVVIKIYVPLKCE